MADRRQLRLPSIRRCLAFLFFWGWGGGGGGGEVLHQVLALPHFFEKIMGRGGGPGNRKNKVLNS